MGFKDVVRKTAHWLLPVVVVACSLLALAAAFFGRTASAKDISVKNGVLDIRGLDVASNIYAVDGQWEFYPGALYDPADFAAGAVGQPAQDASPSDWSCGTHRLRILARPNQYYALCGFSPDYATRVFVNGVQAAEYGRVSETEEGFVPRVGYMTVPLFSGTGGEIELIVQYSNYVHNDGGHIPPFELSTPQNIEEFKAAGDLVSLALSGGLLLLAAYFLLSAAVRNKPSFLCLALCCVLTALRDQNFFVVHLLTPDTSWYLAYRALILIVMLMPVSILLMLKCQYWKASAQGPLWAYLGMAAAAGVLICLLPTRELVTVSTLVYYLSVPYLAYLVFGVARVYLRRKKLEPADVLVLLGFVLLLTGLVYEALMTGRSAQITRYGATACGMLGFVFLNAVAMSLRGQRQEAELIASRSRSEMLEKMNQLNMDFLHKVAHELKTPLTVISGYAQLTGMQLAAGRVTEEAPANLKTIQQEAQRLANMVTRLMEYSYGRKSELSFGPVKAEELLESVGAIAVPMCVKNNNTVQVLPCGPWRVHGNFEMLLQIFINLVVNASKNTQNGQITISAEDVGQKNVVLFRVADTGCGIDPALLPHIFEQGVSSGGGSGLGLTICREAVEAHGGEIWVERTGPGGTTMAFTVLKEAKRQ